MSSVDDEGSLAFAHHFGFVEVDRDPDRPERAEHALTAVRRSWRGRGIASHLKRRTLHWAALNGVEVAYTSTQACNVPTRQLNELLGYVTSRNSITVSHPLRSPPDSDELRCRAGRPGP